MRYYKGLFFPDGKPVPVGFERRPEENSSNLKIKLKREARRLDEDSILARLNYNYEQIHARTGMQTWASNRKNAGTIEFVDDYQTALSYASQGSSIDLMFEYWQYLRDQKNPSLNGEIAAIDGRINQMIAAKQQREQLEKQQPKMPKKLL